MDESEYADFLVRLWRKCRKESGLARFERKHRDWKVPGSHASGARSMLWLSCWDRYRLEAKNPEV